MSGNQIINVDSSQSDVALYTLPVVYRDCEDVLVHMSSALLAQQKYTCCDSAIGCCLLNSVQHGHGERTARGQQEWTQLLHKNSRGPHTTSNLALLVSAICEISFLDAHADSRACALWLSVPYRAPCDVWRRLSVWGAEPE